MSKNLKHIVISFLLLFISCNTKHEQISVCYTKADLRLGMDINFIKKIFPDTKVDIESNNTSSDRNIFTIEDPFLISKIEVSKTIYFAFRNNYLKRVEFFYAFDKSSNLNKQVLLMTDFNCLTALSETSNGNKIAYIIKERYTKNQKIISVIATLD